MYIADVDILSELQAKKKKRLILLFVFEIFLKNTKGYTWRLSRPCKIIKSTIAILIVKIIKYNRYSFERF